MHKQILPVPDGYEVDHIDGDGTHNKVKNLRKSTKSQNAGNMHKQGNATSRYKGVCRQSNCNSWMARIMVDYKSIYLGSYKNEEDAARAYNKAAIKYFGEFARLNDV